MRDSDGSFVLGVVPTSLFPGHDECARNVVFCRAVGGCQLLRIIRWALRYRLRACVAVSRRLGRRSRTFRQSRER